PPPNVGYPAEPSASFSSSISSQEPPIAKKPAPSGSTGSSRRSCAVAGAATDSRQVTRTAAIDSFIACSSKGLPGEDTALRASSAAAVPDATCAATAQRALRGRPGREGLQVLLCQVREHPDLRPLPGFVPVEFRSEQGGRPRRHVDGGAGVQEQRAGAAREHVLDGPRHLVPCRP